MIPKDLEFIIEDRASGIPIDCACKCDISIELTIQFVYCEATSLLQGCLNSKSACSIYMDELVPTGDDVLYPRECIHRFHINCIVKWVRTSTICLVYHHNYSKFISKDYMLMRERMLTNHVNDNQ